MIANFVLVPLLTLGQTASPVASKDKVRISHASEKPGDGTRIVRIELDIHEGWRVPANPVELDDFESEQIVVRATIDGKAADAKIVYPPPSRRIKFDDLGQLAVYEGTVTILATMPNANPVDVVVAFRAMNDRVCIRPSTVRLKVE